MSTFPSTLSIQVTPIGLSSVDSQRDSANPSGALITGISGGGTLATHPWKGTIELKRDVKGKEEVVRKFEIEATYAYGLDEASVKKYWEAQINYLYDHHPEQLPPDGKTNEVTIHKDKIEVKPNDKTGENTFISDELIADTCEPYVKGDKESLNALVEALEESNTNFQSIRSQPVTIEHGQNTCYLATATWAILNDPILLTVLPHAARKGSDEKLSQLNEYIKSCIAHHKNGTTVPAKEVEKLGIILNQIIPGIYPTGSEQDASEALVLLSDLILEKSKEKISLERTFEMDGGSQIPSKEALESTIRLPLKRINANGKSTTSVPENTQLENLLDHHFHSTNTDYYEPRTLDGRKKTDENPNVAVITHSTKLTNVSNRISIGLGRDQTSEANGAEKLSTKIDVPLELTLKKQFYKDTLVDEDPKYILGSIIVHSGNGANSGHYRTIVRKPDSNGKYINYLCDDIGKTPIQTITDDQCKTYAKEAYELIYFKEKREIARRIENTTEPIPTSLPRSSTPRFGGKDNLPSATPKAPPTPLETNLPLDPLPDTHQTQKGSQENFANPIQIYQGPIGKSYLTLQALEQLPTFTPGLIDLKDDEINTYIQNRDDLKELNKLLTDLRKNTSSVPREIQTNEQIQAISDSHLREAVLQAARHLKFKKEIREKIESKDVSYYIDLRDGNSLLQKQSDKTFIFRPNFRSYKIESLQTALKLFREVLEESNLSRNVGLIVENTDESIETALNVIAPTKDQNFYLQAENRDRSLQILVAKAASSVSPQKQTNEMAVSLQIRAALASIKNTKGDYVFDLRPSTAELFSLSETNEFTVNTAGVASQKVRELFLEALKQIELAKGTKIELRLESPVAQTLDMAFMREIDLSKPSFSRVPSFEDPQLQTTVLHSHSDGNFPLTIETADTDVHPTGKDKMKIDTEMVIRIVEAMEKDKDLTIDFRQIAEHYETDIREAIDIFRFYFGQINQLNTSSKRLHVRAIIPNNREDLKVHLLSIGLPTSFYMIDQKTVGNLVQLYDQDSVAIYASILPTQGQQPDQNNIDKKKKAFTDDLKRTFETIANRFKGRKEITIDLNNHSQVALFNQEQAIFLHKHDLTSKDAYDTFVGALSSNELILREGQKLKVILPNGLVHSENLLKAFASIKRHSSAKPIAYSPPGGDSPPIEKPIILRENDANTFKLKVSTQRVNNGKDTRVPESTDIDKAERVFRETVHKKLLSYNSSDINSEYNFILEESPNSELIAENGQNITFNLLAKDYKNALQPSRAAQIFLEEMKKFQFSSQAKFTLEIPQNALGEIYEEDVDAITPKVDTTPVESTAPKPHHQPTPQRNGFFDWLWGKSGS